MIEIRQAKTSDLDSLYQISIETGHAGGDARQLYTDQKLIGHIYSAPYLVFEPELVLVATQEDQVVGYCAGTSDSTEFETKLEKEWWPALREKYPKPNETTRSSWTADEQICQMIHVPEIIPKQITDSFPAHIHMNLLPSAQGQGIGGKILERWTRQAIQLGISAVHIGANANNNRAIGFWNSQGFDKLVIPNQRTVWMARRLRN